MLEDSRPLVCEFVLLRLDESNVKAQHIDGPVLKGVEEDL